MVLWLKPLQKPRVTTLDVILHQPSLIPSSPIELEFRMGAERITAITNLCNHQSVGRREHALLCSIHLQLTIANKLSRPNVINRYTVLEISYLLCVLFSHGCHCVLEQRGFLQISNTLSHLFDTNYSTLTNLEAIFSFDIIFSISDFSKEDSSKY